MPPRIPRIQPEAAGVSLPPQPSLSPTGLAELSTRGSRAVAEQLGVVAKHAEYAYADEQRIQKVVQAQRTQLETEQALGLYDRAAADVVFGLKSDPNVQPEDYAQRVEADLRKVKDSVAKQIKNSAVLPRFEVGAERKITADTTKAKYDGYERRVALNKVGVGFLNRDDENRAVFGLTRADQDAAVGRIVQRLDDQLRSRSMTPGEHEAALTRSLTNIEEGRIRRDWRSGNPETRQQVLDRLTTGGYPMLAPDAQLTMAKTLHDEDERERKNRLAENEKTYKDAKDAALSGLYNEADKKTLTEGQYQAAVKEWQLTPAEQSKLRDAMTAPEKEPPSDAATLDALEPRVHSMSPNVTERELNQLREAGKLNRKDHVRLLDTLDSRRKWHLSHGETVLGRRHNQAEQDLRAALGIPSIGETLDQNAKKAYALAIQELSKRSSYLDGREDPLKIAHDDLIPRFTRMLGAEAKVTEAQVRNALKYPDEAALNAARDRGEVKSGADYDNQRRLLMQIEELQKKQALQEAGKKLQQDLTKALGGKPPASKSGAAAGTVTPD
jgi:hypothetical protein